MELDSFLASPRWDIIKIISQKPSSPIELSEQLGTTTSFISQQLKLLEAARIVSKKRTGEVEKGKPRSIFSLSKESVYLVPLAKGITEKKLVPLSPENKVVLRIWQLEETKIQIILQKLFWRISDLLEDIKGIFLYTKKLTPKIYLISQNNSLTHKINKIKSKEAGQFDIQVIASSLPLAKLESDYLVSLHDPENLLGEHLKGGSEKNE